MLPVRPGGPLGCCETEVVTAGFACSPAPRRQTQMPLLGCAQLVAARLSNSSALRPRDRYAPVLPLRCPWIATLRIVPRAPNRTMQRMARPVGGTFSFSVAPAFWAAGVPDRHPGRPSDARAAPSHDRGLGRLRRRCSSDRRPPSQAGDHSRYDLPERCPAALLCGR